MALHVASGNDADEDWGYLHAHNFLLIVKTKARVTFAGEDDNIASTCLTRQSLRSLAS